MGDFQLRDALGVLLIVVTLVGVADYKAQHLDALPWMEPDRSDHLGAEYNAIATAILTGRGFSDPFRERTGPTAWMPPVLPYLLAGVYAISGHDENAAVQFMLAVHALATWVTGMLVVAQGRRFGLVLAAYGIFIVGCLVNFHELLQKTHDSGLLLLVVDLLYAGVLWAWHGLGRRAAVAWGVFGGFCALCSPVVGATWAAVTAWRLWPRWSGSIDKNSQGEQASQAPIHRTGNATAEGTNPDHHKTRQERTMDCSEPLARWYRVQPLVLAAVTSILVVTPWTIRNRMVLDAWVPIKSNGMYELWQSQCLDTDGVLDILTCMHHPWPGSGPQRQEYAEVGEIDFIAEKGEEAVASILSEPTSYITRVVNRWFATCVYYMAFSQRYESLGDGWPILVKRLVFPLPLIGVLVIVAFCPIPMPPRMLAAIAIGGLVLLPYILVSYYDRYAVPVIGMKMLLVLQATQVSLGRIWKPAAQ